MPSDQEVVRMYNVLPAIEQTKILIIERLKVLFDGINVLFQNKMLNRKDDEIIGLVKSTTISLYLMLKPKIVEYITQLEKISPNSPVSMELVKMIQKIEATIANPNSMTIEDALYYADIINIFCHEYGITRITYFTGTMTPPDKDIYRV